MTNDITPPADPLTSHANATRIQNAVKKVTANARLVRTEEAIFMVSNAGGPAVPLNSPAARRKLAELTGCGPNGKLMDALIDKLSGLGFSTARRATVAMFMYRPLAPQGGQALLVHTGAGVVWRSTGSEWSLVPNGHDGVLFVEEDGFEPIGVEELTEAGRRVIPGSFPTLDAVLLNELPPPEGSLTREEQQALVLATWISLPGAVVHAAGPDGAAAAGGVRAPYGRVHVHGEPAHGSCKGGARRRMGRDDEGARGCSP